MNLAAIDTWITGQFAWLSGWLRELIVVAILIILALVAGRLVRFAWGRIFLPIARRTPTNFDVTILTGTETHAARAAVYLVIYAAASHLIQLPALMGTLSARIIDGFFYALAVLAVTRVAVAAADALTRWYLAEIAAKTSSPLDEQFVPIVNKVLSLAFYFIAATIVLSRFNINVTALVTTAGVASLAVALAAQETLANMFAGFTILVDRSYRVGDRIQLADGTVGDVYDIGMRATKILNFDNELIIVPNKEMAAARIVNQSYPDRRVAARVRVGVSYGTDIEKAKRVMLEVIQAHPKVLKDPAPAVYFTDFGESSLNLLGFCYVENYRERFQTLDELNVAIKKRFDAEGIEIPFPQRDLHLRTLPPGFGRRA